MSKLEHVWPSDAFDAVGILAIEGEFEIKGTDGDQVELAAEFDGRAPRDLVLEPAGRWLQLHFWEHHAETQFTLRLPKNKAWVVDLSAAHADVQVGDVQARLRVMVGKGDVRVKNSRGIFNLASGKGDIELEQCIEAEMPERPPVPQPQFQAPNAPEPPRPGMPPTPEGPGIGGEFHVHFGHGPRIRHKIKPDVSWDWFGFDSEDWTEWGSQFGEQARVWAQQFASHFIGTIDWLPDKAAASVRIGKGDARLQEIDAKSCTVRLGSGSAELKNGRIGELEVGVGHGDVECGSVLPGGEWSIQVKNGDIHLGLPSNTQARLDVATRHGDINSQVPLVRVGRPGPESRYGGRMVGTIGQPGDNIPQLSLTALRGDIDIRLEQEKNRPATKQAASAPPPQAKAPEANPPSVSPVTPAAGEGTAVIETTETAGRGAPADNIKPEQGPAPAEPVYESQLAILKALSSGQLTVEEADHLLRNVEGTTDERRNVWSSVKNLFH